MTYQRDLDLPTRPARDRDPRNPADPLADEAARAGDASRMAPIIGAIAVIALLIIGITFFKMQTVRPCAHRRSGTPDNTAGPAAPSTTITPK